MDCISEEHVVVSGKRREEKNTANKHLPQKRIQYATRGKKHSYCEPEVPDDDHYICEWNSYNFLNTLSLRVFYGVYTGVNPRGPKKTDIVNQGLVFTCSVHSGFSVIVVFILVL